MTAIDLNLPNLEALAQWLEQGAPHSAFDMRYGLTGSGRFEPYDLSETERLKLQDPECGTVCCIAGAAYLLSKDLMDKPEVFRNDYEMDWERVREQALRWLGLEYDPAKRIGHNLFDNNLAPENCTPAQAAEAVRQVMKNEEPWGNEEKETA